MVVKFVLEGFNQQVVTQIFSYYIISLNKHKVIQYSKFKVNLYRKSINSVLKVFCRFFTFLLIILLS